MRYLLFSIILMVSLTRCTNSDEEVKTDMLNGTWNIDNISGGFAGINDDYASGTIAWTFTASTSKLQVVNNNDLASIIYDGLPTGEYDYTILTSEKNSFLSINGQEFAGIIISEGQLVLDQNKTTAGFLALMGLFYASNNNFPFINVEVIAHSFKIRLHGIKNIVYTF